MSNTFIYDRLPYPSCPVLETSPDRLSMMGALFGLETAPPQKCRMLELGCANGTNLVSIAYTFPESVFVGIDLSLVQIEQARAIAAELGVSNVEFRAADVTNVGSADLGEFDFIAAHGLYSWVPAAVRTHILRIYAECLTPAGVGYISYNAYPGSYLRSIARDAMRFHVGNISDPLEQVREGVKFLGFLGGFADTGSPYHKVVKDEYFELTKRSPGDIFHDELEETNQPFYFQEFAHHLAEAGLQFLSESDPVDRTNSLPDSARVAMAAIETDVIRFEQYIDLVCGRRFRSSLLCRAGLTLDRPGRAEIVKTRYMVSKLATESKKPDLSEALREKFSASNDFELEIDHPLTKAALIYMDKVWARAESFDDIISNAGAMLRDPPEQEDIDQTATFLFNLFRSGLVTLHSFRGKCAPSGGERPVASRLGRWLALHGVEDIPTLTGMSLKLDNDLIKRVIVLLDGTKDRKMLESEVLECAMVPDEQRKGYEKALPSLIESTLERLARVGMLENDDQ